MYRLCYRIVSVNQNIKAGGGRKLNNREEFMTATEMSRLSDWLMQEKGMSADEVVECLHYIADKPQKENQVPETQPKE